MLFQVVIIPLKSVLAPSMIASIKTPVLINIGVFGNSKSARNGVTSRLLLRIKTRHESSLVY